MARIGFLTLSEGGVKIASLIFIRALSAVLLIFPLIGTAKFDVTIKALEKLAKSFDTQKDNVYGNIIRALLLVIDTDVKKAA